MAETYREPKYGTKHFWNDFFLVFARLLDPNLPPARAASVDRADDERWPLGQSAAFATLVSLGLWGVIGGIFYFVV